MSNSASHHLKTFSFSRIPKTSDASLIARSAKDDVLAAYFDEHVETAKTNLLVYGDRFGVTTTAVHHAHPVCMIEYASQAKALSMQFEQNDIKHMSVVTHSFTDDCRDDVSMVLGHIPKSMDRFDVYLRHAAAHLAGDGCAVFAFMTRHFTQRMLKLASTYFESVEQSRAFKKARLLILKKPKAVRFSIAASSATSQHGRIYKQWPGVFSAGQIDHATELLVRQLTKLTQSKTLPVHGTHHDVLDIGCGNGVLASTYLEHNEHAVAHLVDDDFFALESAKLNVGARAHFYWSNTLSMFEDQTIDIAFTNPPFHVGHVNSTAVSIQLFKEAKRVLKDNGSLWVVANRHLNYMTHLRRLFGDVRRVQSTKRYEVLHAQN